MRIYLYFSKRRSKPNDKKKAKPGFRNGYYMRKNADAPRRQWGVCKLLHRRIDEFAVVITESDRSMQKNVHSKAQSENKISQRPLCP